MKSEKYEVVKTYWIMKLWNETKVRNAVEKGWITSVEFEEITRIAY